VFISAGTMTDWKLVFYGTEIAPEGDDREDDDSNVQVTGSRTDLKPSEMLTNGDEGPDRNDVVPVKGGVWKELHKMDSTDHARNEVQRTTTEDDVVSASSGCRALSKKGQQCIGLCLVVTFLVSVLNSSFSFPAFFATNCDGKWLQPECTETVDGSTTFPCPVISRQWRTDFNNGPRTERTVILRSEVSYFQTRSH
jgi:hypothetical protein